MGTNKTREAAGILGLHCHAVTGVLRRKVIEVETKGTPCEQRIQFGTKAGGCFASGRNLTLSLLWVHHCNRYRVADFSVME